MSLAIETHGLTRNFGDFCAVDEIELRVEAGTFYGFLGPNGAGKSTTIKMLTGLLAPSKGTMRLLGENPLDRKAAIGIKQRIGVVSEDLALFDYLKAREYLMFIGRMFGVDRDTIEDRTDQLLTLLRMDDVDKKLILEYSHGMKKKVALAAALLPDPELLFLDEPFEGVDAVTSAAIREVLSSFVSRGSTVFLTSHVLSIVEQLCTHVGIISHGELVEQTSLDELRQGSSLEAVFLEKVGSSEEAMQTLSWLGGDANSSSAEPMEIDFGESIAEVAESHDDPNAASDSSQEPS
ncbi:MAG: multidrug ABC transporter ATP-binding protein [Planctomycetaceae bacterium]|nr:multidrug ABC transporter ATP-binding protein [Planctomycetaceae bacterium]